MDIQGDVLHVRGLALADDHQQRRQSLEKVDFVGSFHDPGIGSSSAKFTVRDRLPKPAAC
jgi:hypothetical protein